MRGSGLALPALFLAIASGANAEVEARPVSEQDRRADFLFGRPRGAVTIRGGWQMARTSSDIYDFFTEELTIDKSDFDSPVFAVDVGFAVHNRIDLLVGFEFTRTSVSSESREFVDENGLPIVQNTRLTTVPLMGGGKFYLTPRGRQVSRYAFVPAKVRPYVGGGGGFVWYELEQVGDFVDFTDLTIFTGSFRSSGWGFAAQGFGGVEVTLGPRWFFSFDARYLWADAELGDDFVSFEPIDLSGARITGGVGFSF